MTVVARSPTLAGEKATLVPLSAEHVPDLLAAALEDRSSYGYVPLPANEAEMRAYVSSASEEAVAGRQLPFVVVGAAEDRVVGCTRFAELAQWRWPAGCSHQRADGRPDAVEIGYTWLAASAQGSGINAECKLLMLRHAFEEWEVHRVRFRTDVRNARSRRALDRIGARLDGVLRADWPGADCTVRDSALYSITAGDWPAVRALLTELLQRRVASDGRAGAGDWGR
jgi:RimJ/RimL family protein N-acetyltransferase